MKQKQTGMAEKQPESRTECPKAAGEGLVSAPGQDPWNFPQFGFLANDYQLRGTGSLPLC